MNHPIGPEGPKGPSGREPCCAKCLNFSGERKEVDGKPYCTFETRDSPSCYQKQVSVYDTEVCIFCSEPTDDTNFSQDIHGVFLYCYDCAYKTYDIKLEECYMCSDGEDSEKVCSKCMAFVRCFKKY